MSAVAPAHATKPTYLACSLLEVLLKQNRDRYLLVTIKSSPNMPGLLVQRGPLTDVVPPIDQVQNVQILANILLKI